MATILYVDDEAAVGLILEDTLAQAGHSPVGARSVPEALQVLNSPARDRPAPTASTTGLERLFVPGPVEPENRPPLL